ncbi:MAG: 30S ribosomal protein S8 [Ignavibacteriales bacterium]|nr:30S ribosomal protein S8 [Ignavibacteriales bacterium]
MHTDPIADYLTRMRNALKAGKKSVNIPLSNLKLSLTEVLISLKYISGYDIVKEGPQPLLRITLRYYEGQPVISGLRRISKPGLRIYSNTEELPRVLNGMGNAIISTSRGILTDQQARTLGVGGEVLCYVW